MFSKTTPAVLSIFFFIMAVFFPVAPFAVEEGDDNPTINSESFWKNWSRVEVKDVTNTEITDKAVGTLPNTERVQKIPIPGHIYVLPWTCEKRIMAEGSNNYRLNCSLNDLPDKAKITKLSTYVHTKGYNDVRGGYYMYVLSQPDPKSIDPLNLPSGYYANPPEHFIYYCALTGYGNNSEPAPFTSNQTKTCNGDLRPINKNEEIPYLRLEISNLGYTFSLGEWNEGSPGGESPLYLIRIDYVLTDY